VLNSSLTEILLLCIRKEFYREADQFDSLTVKSPNRLSD